MVQNSGSLTVTLIMVMSVNGVVARNSIENSFEWNSEEDRIQFMQRIREIGTVFMGANTYRSLGSKPYEGIDFYVLTHHPAAFPQHSRVIFLNDKVENIYENLRKSGLKRIALLGGPQTNKLFFDQGLVDEIYLTIEPTFMPEGMHMIQNLNRRVPLQLDSMEVLNQQKTLLLHYFVLKAEE
ncbi:dihydrofolate reductase family protein [bacterium]|nr:dihydrofolate reductase family protein [bacterium]